MSSENSKGIISGKPWAVRGAGDIYSDTFPGEDPLGARLLLGRGISDEQGREKFFSPDYDRDMHDPFLLRDMKRVAERIVRAIKERERIVVFGDYDADGVCGASIFSELFTAVGFKNFIVYIPDRYKEGYGLSEKAVESIIQEKPNLVITVDCGVTNFNEIERLQSLGIDAIVIDHHIVPPRWPNAFAIIDAKKEDETYPFKFLCGAGMAFKTASAVLREESFGLPSGWEKWLLDLAAIATVADMVPLTDENRVIVHYGLKVLQKKRRVGLAILLDKLQISTEYLTAEDIGFMIAPHVNAASRMGNDTTSFSLLTTGSHEEASWLVDRMISTKAEQTGFVDQVVDGVHERFPEGAALPEVIVTGDPSWHPGVLGIAANRILEHYARPVFLWGRGEESETIKGSARSRGETSVVEIMRHVPEGFFIDFGGHHAAGGFAFDPVKTGQFAEVIGEAARSTPRTEVNEAITADAELELRAVSRDLLSRVGRFEPFGMENPKPLFMFKNIPLKHISTFGKSGMHLKMAFHKESGGEINAIAFWRGKDFPIFEKEGEGATIDLLANVELSRFRGLEELRLRVVDYKLSGI